MPYTLITGASSGIGAGFAEALAASGRNLLLVARSGEALDALAARLRHPGIDIQCLAADLARPEGVAAVCAWPRERQFAIDLLINNAGAGSGGPFAPLPLRRELEIVELNVAALVALTHHFLAEMQARGAGAIVNVASTAGFQPVPYMATYAATKAFVLNFTLALYEENRAAGVHLLALCPGPTRTRFFEAAGIQPRGGRFQSVSQVIAAGLAGLERRRPLVVCGWRNRILVAAERALPRPLLLRAVAHLMKGHEKP